MPSNHSSERERDFSANSTADTSGRSTPDTRDRSGGSTSGGQSNHSSERERDTSLGGGNTGGSNSGRGGNTSAGEQSNHASERERDFSVSGGGFNAAADRSPDRPDNYAAGMNDLGRGTSASGLGAGRSPDRPDNYMAGRNDLTRSGSSPSTPTGYSPTGRTGGFSQAVGPSYRQAEIESMRAMSAYNNSIAPTHRATEEASMRSLAFNNIIDRIIGVESGGVATAKNPMSTATGAGQFISSTWMNMVERYRPDLLANRTRQEILGLRTDPVIAREMVENYARENIAALTRNNIEVTPSSVYAAHFLGPAGAVDLYTSPRSTPAVDVFGQAAVNANGSIMSGTIGRVQDYIDRKFSGVETNGYSPVSGAARQSSPSAAPVGPRGGDTALPADRPVTGPAGGANALPADRPLTGPAGGSTALPAERPSFAERYLDRPAPVDPNYQASPSTVGVGATNREIDRSVQRSTPSTVGVGADVREIDRSAVGRAPEMIGDQRELDRSLDGMTTAADRPDNRNYGGPVGMGGAGGTYVGDVPHRDMTTDPATRDGWSPMTGGHVGARDRELDRSLSGLATAANRPDNLNYGGPRGMGGPGGMYVGDTPARTGRQDGWSTPSVAPTQPSGAQPGAVGPGQSVSPVSPSQTGVAPAQTNPQTVTGNEVPQQRSIGQRVAAGAIDIGAGMIPGIGPAIGIGNGIAAAIGARTLGERIVDGAGENTYQPGQVPDREGGRGDAPGWFREPGEAVDGPSDEVATPDDPVMTFTRRYLDPSRPTPGQKWGRPNQYGGVDLVG